jgi:hypothetical protein
VVERKAIPVRLAVAVRPAWEAHYLSTAAMSQLIALPSMPTALPAARAAPPPSVLPPQALVATPILQPCFPSFPQAATVNQASRAWQVSALQVGPAAPAAMVALGLADCQKPVLTAESAALVVLVVLVAQEALAELAELAALVVLVVP